MSLHAPSQSAPAAGKTNVSQTKLSYAEHKERQKSIKKAERAVKDSEDVISRLEARIKELETMMCDPAYASDMKVIGEYTDVKKQLDDEETRWEELSEQYESLLSE